MTQPVRSSAASPADPASAAPDRVWTVPNLLSVLRLAGVPLVLWLLLGPQADGWAVLVLVLSGLSDWLDGKLARWLGQYSRLGALLDPAVDRVYVLAVLAALGLRGIVPWWLVGLLIGRDLVLAASLVVLRRRGVGPYEVSYLGKGATFLLLYALPLLLLAEGDGAVAAVAAPVGVAFAGWGAALYLYTALLYLTQFAAALSPRVAAAVGAAGSDTRSDSGSDTGVDAGSRPGGGADGAPAGHPPVGPARARRDGAP